ncbi:hypothetical protein C5167_033906, partial [Papaver somniferum]
MESDKLDHVPLAKRQRMLLSRQSLDTVSQQQDTCDMECITIFSVELGYLHLIMENSDSIITSVDEETTG